MGSEGKGEQNEAISEDTNFLRVGNGCTTISCQYQAGREEALPEKEGPP